MTYKENIGKQIKYGASLIGGCLLGKVIVEAIMEALGSSISPEKYLVSGFGIAGLMIGWIRIHNGINTGSHMQYWKEVKFYALMTPVMLVIMFLPYYINVYAGLREPIAGMAGYVPTFLGTLVGYIFLVPFINYYMSKTQFAKTLNTER